MPASERIVYGREFRVTPVWMWLLQRASGLLLGPLVALHVLVPGMAGARWLNAILLAIVLVHGVSGVRRMAAAVPRAGWYALLAAAWGIVVVGFGLVLIVAGV